jgi:hypothetical protein
MVDGSDVEWFLIGAFHISDAESSRLAVAVNHLLITYCLYKTYMKGKERKRKEKKGKERKRKERAGKERKSKERKGNERKGKERRGKERKGKERKGSETKGK